MTVNEIMKLKPCYSREKVKSLFGDRVDIPLREILQLDNIPLNDRISLGLKIYPSVRFTIIDRAIRNHCLDCGIPLVEVWATEWLKGNHNFVGARAAANAAYTDARVAYTAANAVANAAYEANAANAVNAANAAAYVADAAVYAAANAAAYVANAANAANAAAYVADAANAANAANEKQLQLQDILAVCDC